MKLRDLLPFDSIVIQTHDNPDADAIASGFGLYSYFLSKGKKVRLIYGGKNKIGKSNLLLMTEMRPAADGQNGTRRYRGWASECVISTACIRAGVFWPFYAKITA